MNAFLTTLITLVALILSTAPAHAKTVRLFVIGNSFSGNAINYLPRLAKEGGHELIIGKAQLGGCPLERHWKGVEANLANPDDPAGKPYGGKSLGELLSDGKWDVVTVQQYSMFSANVDTYRPFAQKLHDYIKKLQPEAEVVVHQTWAYRTDAKLFAGRGGKRGNDQQDMWQNSRASYHEIAGELGSQVIPSGDAFWRVDSDSEWGYKKDSIFDFENAAPPALPNQEHSLHQGYSWGKDKKLNLDANHAGPAGCYLAGLVWYGFLFDESPAKSTFVPKEVPAEFAAHLREVAAEVLAEQAEKKEPAAAAP